MCVFQTLLRRQMLAQYTEAINKPSNSPAFAQAPAGVPVPAAANSDNVMENFTRVPGLGVAPVVTPPRFDS